jgi:hypothetical protein
MNGSPIAQGMPAIPQGRQRGRPKSALWSRKSALGAKELQLHATLKADGSLKSGRGSGYVYYMFHGRQCWRRYVAPKDPRTLPQLRSRAVFGAASKAWSESRRLTVEVRAVWYAAAEKVQSRPRLGQSGPLTGPLLFVGLNCDGEQTGREMLWQPPQPNAQTARAKREDAQSASQLTQLESVTRTVSVLPRCCGTNTKRQHRSSPCCTAKSQNTIISPQLVQPQRVARPTWERPQTATGVPPEWCRCTARFRRCVGKNVFGQSRASVTGVHRNYHWREAWRGG